VRVLLTGPNASAEASFASILCEAEPEAEVIVDPLSPDLLEQVASGAFDGVVCRADGSEAIDLVAEIRDRNKQVPIVVLSEKADSGFETQAIRRGATLVVSTEADARVIAENVRRMVSLKGAMREFEENARTNQRLRQELMEAVLQQKSISQYGGHVNRHWLRRGLVPLLVENDPEEAFLMVKAFDKAEVHAPLPIMRSAPEALSYLQGSPPFENRNVHPLPNAILLDLNPFVLGIELLQWIRRQGHLAAVPVIVLSGSGSPEEIREAYSGLANSYLIKSGNFDDLVAMIQAIDVYWTRMNIGRPV